MGAEDMEVATAAASSSSCDGARILCIAGEAGVEAEGGVADAEIGAGTVALVIEIEDETVALVVENGAVEAEAEAEAEAVDFGAEIGAAEAETEVKAAEVKADGFDSVESGSCAAEPSLLYCTGPSPGLPVGLSTCAS
jgi:hypothetical protein